MKKNLLLICSAIVLLTNSISVTQAQQKNNDKDVWMLTYFRQRYPTRIEINEKGETVEVPLPDPMLVAKLHVALSTDGRNWKPLNDNKPIWEQFMRDQYIHRGSDGLWRLIATGGSGNADDRKRHGPSCTYATSTDLINWKVEDYLHLMKDVRNEAGELVRNIWAPEFFYDDKNKRVHTHLVLDIQGCGMEREPPLVL